MYHILLVRKVKVFFFKLSKKIKKLTSQRIFNTKEYISTVYSKRCNINMKYSTITIICYQRYS